MSIRTRLAYALVLASMTLLPAAADDSGGEAPVIEIAILLDTSNSMDGLIQQAKTQLWAIVNDLALASKDGKTPNLRVALYEYGNQGLPAETGYIRMVLDFTGDLDKVSEQLFGLTTNGGDEYCGQVVGRATRELSWTEGDHYRAIFIAGNEPFTQGSEAYTDSCAAAIARGILVNTIHCGTESEGRDGKWDHAAAISDGRFTNIDQNSAVVAIAAPQDAELAKLNDDVNATYIPYGAKGQEGLENQTAQDTNAGANGEAVLALRCVTKGSCYYWNDSWDLVDALAQKKVELASVKDEDLPQEMRGLSIEEKQAFVDAKALERTRIRQDIDKLAEARRVYVADQMQAIAEAGQATFQGASEAMLREQLEERAFSFRK